MGSVSQRLVLDRSVQINPRAKSQDLLKMLGKTGQSVNITVKEVLYQHGFEALLQKQHIKEKEHRTHFMFPHLPNNG